MNCKYYKRKYYFKVGVDSAKIDLAVEFLKADQQFQLIPKCMENVDEKFMEFKKDYSAGKQFGIRMFRKSVIRTIRDWVKENKPEMFKEKDFELAPSTPTETKLKYALNLFQELQ